MELLIENDYIRRHCIQERQSISVCMAVHNGSKFIEEQIASILPQLGENDELVIVDDASIDETIAIIEGFNDEHIRLVRHEYNRGVIQSFEHALKEAKGEIIFLADQDDIWRPDKVVKFLEMFRIYPDVTVVQSDCSIIDYYGNITSKSRLKMRGIREFYPGALRNLARNLYQGSAMAFRRSILEFCLPFPVDIPMHDMWIGIVNQFVGKAGFIEKPLLLWRRHGGNDSRENHAPLMQMIIWRLALVKNLAILYAKLAVLRRGHVTI